MPSTPNRIILTSRGWKSGNHHAIYAWALRTLVSAGYRTDPRYWDLAGADLYITIHKSRPESYAIPGTAPEVLPRTCPFIILTSDDLPLPDPDGSLTTRSTYLLMQVRMALLL